MKLEDLRQQVRAELAAVDPDGTADPAEIDRLVREVIFFGLRERLAGGRRPRPSAFRMR